MTLPLEGITVLELGHFLSAPLASLRLADLGAKVIKVEIGIGDPGRNLYFNGLQVDESSLLFHTTNRNKESILIDLAKKTELDQLKKLIATADVFLHNLDRQIITKHQLNYDKIIRLNPKIIYTEIAGYGNQGPWKDLPNLDLIVQAMSGLSYCTGNNGDSPTPFGLPIGDYLCGNQAVQGIIAALIHKSKTGKGTLLQLSIMESLIDFQFEFFTTYFHSKKQHERSKINNAHNLLSAPYGIYQTKNGFIAIAMMPLSQLNQAIQCAALAHFSQDEVFAHRDEIKAVIAAHLRTENTETWLDEMRKLDLWVMPVLNWQELTETETYQSMVAEQHFSSKDGNIQTTRCPIRINGNFLLSDKPASSLVKDTAEILFETAYKTTP